MGSPGAKQGDDVIGLDTHVVLVPSPAGPTPTPTPMPFNGKLTGDLSDDVFIESKAAAIEGSTAQNLPPHVPAGGPFQKPPANTGSVSAGSASVFINNKAAARAGDPVKTCNDPADADKGVIQCAGAVMWGD